MRTIMATSADAAAKIYIQDYPVCEGDEVSVKKRGSGSWEEYEIREAPKPRKPRQPDYTKTKAR